MPPDVQSFPPGPIGQLIVPHEDVDGVQLTSHRHELAQSIVLHAPCVVHATVHAPGPQLTPLHAPATVHWTSHDCACEQSMSPHPAVSVHEIMQRAPVGHVNGVGPGLTTRHCPVASHDEHADGHTKASGFLASTTCWPSTQ